MRLDVDGGTYTSACSLLYDANHVVVDAVSTLSSSVDAGGEMAGTDTGGEAWAAQYDAVAGQLLEAGADLGESMGKMANLLNASLVNHRGADYGATVGAGPDGGGFDGDADPDHWTESVYCPAPPSARGGTGDQPGWWHWIAGHVEGLLWPDADTGKLREVGAAWLKAGQSLSSSTSSVSDAGAEISGSSSPEVDDAVATCKDLTSHLSDVGRAYSDLGHACNDYASAVDEQHRRLEDELESFVGWTLAIEGAGAVVGFFTLGLGEGVAQAAEAAEVANAASRAARLLTDLVAVARAEALEIGDLVTTATSAIERVQGILGAKIVTALAKVGVTIAKDSRSRLLEELAAQGVKHDPGQVVTIFRNAEGRIVWLEKGDAKRGLAHIVGEHGPEFAQKGIPEAEIPSAVQTALTKGKIVDYQGKGVGRPVYEVEFGGRTIRIAITTGKNGYIVGANLR